MGARADYLSKYLSGSEGTAEPRLSKKKKKAKKKTEYAEPTRIVIHGQLGATPEPPHQVQMSTLEDDTDEYSPVLVSGTAPVTPNKGFKRIDNGKLSMSEQSAEPKAHPSDEVNQTVYRDLKGMIVDLEAKRTELKALKDKEAAESMHQEKQINTGDMDKIRVAQEARREAKSTRFDYSKTDIEYMEHMKQKKQFDDPVNSFAEKAVAPTSEVNATGRPVYAKGANPVNRFQIKAGHFWDGIDRSNGFEEKLLSKREEAEVTNINKKAFQESYTEYDFD